MHVYELAAGMAAQGDPDEVKRGVGWMLASFVLTFLATRFVTRMIRAGKGPFRDMKLPGGLHVHHQVYGIFLMLVSGAAQFAYEPDTLARDILAAVFGAGAALTLDEFALWFHLDDVYWSADGRKSVDAVLIAAAIGILLLFGANPFDIGSGDSKPAIFAVVVVDLAFSFAAIFKGKVATGLIGIFVPTVAWIAAVRIAKPDSPWARWRYPEGSRSRQRSLRRFPPGRRTHWDRFKDLLGGAPSR